MNTRILLPSAAFPEAPSEDTQLMTAFERESLEINEFDVRGTVSQYMTYVSERDTCTKYRIIVTVDPVCTNILFNPVTIVLDKNGNRIKDSELGKTPVSNTLTDALYCPSQSKYDGFTFYCGYSVFDNSMFRTKLFKKSLKLDTLTTDIDAADTPKRFIYLMDDVIAFPDAIDSSIVEHNGWAGFMNPSKLVTMEKERVLGRSIRQRSSFSFLAGKSNCDFIDMFPTRDMFHFSPVVLPKDDSFSVENNWSYLLTYPCGKDTEHFLVKGGIPVMNVTIVEGGDKNSIYSFPVLVIDTAYAHGLSVSDTVSVEWPAIEEGAYVIKRRYRVINVVSTVRIYVEHDGMVNDNELMRGRLKRVVNAVESEYYIKRLRKIPNWKYEDEEITPDNVEEKLKKNGTPFASSIYTLSFAENIYGDPVSQVVFEDSIDLKYLKDHRGRPLTEIYFTVIKNTSSNCPDTVYQKYWSKVTSGFELTDLTSSNRFFGKSLADMNAFKRNYSSIRTMHNVSGSQAVEPESPSPPYMMKIAPFENMSSYTDTAQPDLKFAVSACSMDYDVILLQQTGEGEETVKNTTGRAAVTVGENGEIKSIDIVNPGYGYSAGEIIPVQYDNVSARANVSEISPDGGIKTASISEAGSGYMQGVEMYGDITEFNAYEMSERTLSPVMHRFNTLCRESLAEEDRIIKFHEVYQDDMDKGFNSSGQTQLSQYNALAGQNFAKTMTRSCDGGTDDGSNYIYRGLLVVGPRPEGYCYAAHTPLKLKQWSQRLNYASFPQIHFTEKGAEQIPGNRDDFKRIYFISEKKHRLLNESLIRIEWKTEGIKYDRIYAVRTDMRDPKKFSVVYDADLDAATACEVRMFSYDVPAYSEHVGNGNYVWKNILKEGEMEDVSIPNPEHVFTNGHIYIDKSFRFYQLRQDPFGVSKLRYDEWPNDIGGTMTDLSASIYTVPVEDC
jgi:hypothetical protein